MTLEDFNIPGTNLYMDGNGDHISQAEAQAEVDYYNEHLGNV